MSKKPYKLEINGQKSKVDFGPRQPGDIGRDILAIKYALGQVEQYKKLINPEDKPEFDDPNGWFDCIVGKPVSNIEAAKFDKNLQAYLINFQLQNQYYMLSYYFTKFAVPRSISRKNAINRIQEFEGPSQGHELEAEIAPWASSGNRSILLPGGTSIKLGETINNPADGSFSEETNEVEHYTSHGLLSQQLELVSRMFSDEFGKIGEATLAIMHGWLPRTKLYNDGFRYDEDQFKNEDSAYDVILAPIYNSSVVHKTIPQNIENNPEIDVHISPRNMQRRNFDHKKYMVSYTNQALVNERIEIDIPNHTRDKSESLLPLYYTFQPKHFAALKYKTSARPVEYKSPLHSSVISIENILSEEESKLMSSNVKTLSSSDYSDALMRMYEPDPFIDPDPFVIDQEKIGYFYSTEYTFDNLPPLDTDSSDYQNTIERLEQEVLLEILEFYGKPKIFYLDTRDPKFQDIFIGKREKYFKVLSTSLLGPLVLTPSHKGEYLSDSYKNTKEKDTLEELYRDIWVLTPDSNYNPSIHSGKVQKYSAFEKPDIAGIGSVVFSGENPFLRTERLVRFVEYITPSFRPGDTYRAKFFINKRKLDYITKGWRGTREQIERDSSKIVESTKTKRIASRVANLAQNCNLEGAPPQDFESWKGLSEADQQRRYEEYKALASKRKTEIKRALREKTLETWNNKKSAHSIDVNLGVLGNPNLGLTGFVKNSYDYTTDAMGFFGNAFNSAFEASIENPSFSKSEVLSISYQSLVTKIRDAANYVRQAYLKALEDKIKFNPPSYNGVLQATLLSNVPAELMECIKKYKVPNQPPFNFRAPDDTFAGQTENFFGLASDDIKFNFAPTKGGLKIIEINAAGSIISEENISKYPSLSDPVTVAYLAQIDDMAPAGGKIPFVTTLTDSCREIGIGVRGLGYLAQYTPGLGGSKQDYDPINQWYQENVKEPFNNWMKVSQQNLENSFKPNFDEDGFLNLFGKSCTVEILYREYAQKLSLVGLLCDFLRCIRLPQIELNIPNLQIPPFPYIGIFGWYRGFIETLIEKWDDILYRILCTFMRMILDFLKFPFCQEQLRDQLFGEMSSTSPIVQQALVDGLTDLGLSPESFEPAKDFAADSLVFLTGDELCRLFNGERIDPAAMAMLERLAKRKGIKELNTPDSILLFFETIGIFMPESFCEDLLSDPNRNWAIGSTGPISFDTRVETASCDAEANTSYVNQIRKRMLAGGATDEEIEKAIQLAQRNLLDQAKKFEALGEKGIAGLLPELIGFGDQNALVNDFPEDVKVQIADSLKGLFESARTGYISSLTSFGPSLFLDSPKILGPGDEDYDERSNLIVMTILENYRHYGYLLQIQGNRAPSEEDLIKQLNALHFIYETTTYRGKTVLQAYKLAENAQPGLGSWKETYPYELQNPNAPGQTNFIKIDHSEVTRLNSNVEFWHRPVGYKENGFFDFVEVTTNGRIERKIENKLAAGENLGRFSFQNPLSTRIVDLENAPAESNLSEFSFVNNYRLLKDAERRPNEPIEVTVLSVLRDQGLVDSVPDSEGGSTTQTVVQEGSAITELLQAISRRLQVMQQELTFRMQNISKQLPGSQYLGGIKEVFSLAYETALEDRTDGDNPDAELIDFQSQKGLLLNLAFGGLRSSVNYVEKAMEGENDYSIDYDPYHIDIYNTTMFRDPQGIVRGQEDPIRIKVCDRMPGPGVNADPIKLEELRSVLEADGSDNFYSRREMFSRLVVANVNTILKRYTRNLRPGTIGKIKNAMKDSIYGRSIEGIFEQVFFSMRNSKIYDEEGYYPGLDKRVSGETYFDEVKQCYRNRFNVSQFGILSFEKIVTDELAQQMALEMAKPENSPLELQSGELGPIEKAVQNVCLIGFIRICLVELMLKGALAYTVWGFEGVYDEPIMQNFIYEYVKSELNRKESMRQNWKSMISRLTGQSSVDLALKKLVKQQSMKLLELSKKIYLTPSENESPEETDEYMDWYTRSVIPQSHISKRIAISTSQNSPARTSVNITGDRPAEQGISIGFTGRTDEFVGDIIWQHPLLDVTNIEDFTTEFQDPDYVFNFGRNNNPFFHIEHFLRVQGPLAAIEGLSFPAVDIVEQVLGVDGEDLVDEKFKTEVLPEQNGAFMPRYHNQFDRPGKYYGQSNRVYDGPTRDETKLSVAGALDRFLNLKKIYRNTDGRGLNLYGLNADPNLPADSAGSSAETAVATALQANDSAELYVQGTENFNVDEFIESLNIKLITGESGKLRNHLLGLMDTYDPDDPNRDKYLVRDTQIGEFVGRPETIRRTPFRLIKKIRRIVKIEKDFISHGFDAFYPGEESVHEYRKALNMGRVYPAGLTSESTTNSSTYSEFHNFKNYVSTSEDKIDYFIVPENAEDLKIIDDALDISSGRYWRETGFNPFVNLFRPGASRNTILENYKTNYENLRISPNSQDKNLLKRCIIDKIDVQHGSEIPLERTSHNRLRSPLGVLDNNAFNFYDLFDESTYSSNKDLFDLLYSSSPVFTDFRDQPYSPYNVMYHGIELQYGYGPNDDGSALEPFGITVGPGSNFLEIKEIKNIYSEDFIIYKPRINFAEEVVLFQNKVGHLNGEIEYNEIKEKLYDNESIEILEETWVETVYEFSGDASILAGLYGSFTIGETMDRGALEYAPSNATIRRWNDVLMPLIYDYSTISRQSDHRDPSVVWRVHSGPSDMEEILADGYSADIAEGAGGYRKADSGATHFSFGRPYHSTFWTKENNVDVTGGDRSLAEGFLGVPDGTLKSDGVLYSQGVDIAPYISRPMGINRFTNIKLTSKLLTRWPERDDPYAAAYAPYSAERGKISDEKLMSSEQFLSFNRSIRPWYLYHEDGAILDGAPMMNTRNFDKVRFLHNAADTTRLGGYKDVSKIVHGKPGIIQTPGSAGSGLRYKKGDLLPPNIYKVPLRILTTQVYVAGSVTKVYSKVVPPKYIERMHKSREELGYSGEGERHPNSAALDSSIRRIISDYQSFCNDISSVVSDEDIGRGTRRIAKNNFDSYSLNFPEFTREMSFRAEVKDKPYRRSYLQPDSHVQFCSIERIYSEAFAAETKVAYYNSDVELDELFNNNRGLLMKKPDMSYLSSTNPIAEKARRDLDLIDRIRLYESGHFFYHLPHDQVLGPSASNHNFHRTVFSLHNILQSYLRNRGNKHNSLWGALTPINPSYCTPPHEDADHSFAEDSLRDLERQRNARQKFPLVQTASRKAARPDSWHVCVFPSPAMGYDNEFEYIANRNRFFDHEDIVSHGVGPLLHELSIRNDALDRAAALIRPDNEYMRYYNRLGSMTLTHDIIYNTADGARPSRSTSMTYKEQNGLSERYRPVTMLSRYTRDQNENIITSNFFTDGVGDYYVNYNRKKDFKIFGNGSGLYYADGKFSYEDIMKSFRSMLAAVFVRDGAEGKGEANIDQIFEGFYENLFLKGGKAWTKDTAEFFGFLHKIIQMDEDTFREDGEGMFVKREDQEFSEIQFSRLELESIDLYLERSKNTSDASAAALADATIDDAQDEITREIPKSRRSQLARIVEQIIVTIKSSVEHLIERCGAMVNYQVDLENVHGKNIFSEARLSLRRLELLRRIIVKLQNQTFSQNNLIKKLGIIYVITRYDFTEETIKLYNPENSEIYKEREKYIYEWAKVCLYYMHIITTVFQIVAKPTEDDLDLPQWAGRRLNFVGSHTADATIRLQYAQNSEKAQRDFERFKSAFLRKIPQSNQPGTHTGIARSPDINNFTHYTHWVASSDLIALEDIGIGNVPVGTSANRRAYRLRELRFSRFNMPEGKSMLSDGEVIHEQATEYAESAKFFRYWAYNHMQFSATEISNFLGQNPQIMSFNNPDHQLAHKFNLIAPRGRQGVNNSDAGAIENDSPTHRAFSRLCNIIIGYGPPRRNLYGGDVIGDPDATEEDLEQANKFIAPNTPHFKISGGSTIPVRHYNHYKPNKMGFLGFDFLGGEDGTGDFYPLDSQHRVVAKLGTNRMQYRADHFGRSKEPEANYHPDVYGGQSPLPWYRTDLMDPYRHHVFSLYNMKIFLPRDPSKPNSEDGAFNYFTYRKVLRFAPEDALVRPTAEQIIKDTHMVFDYLANLKPFDTGFFRTVFPHVEGEYGGIARGFENLHLMAFGNGKTISTDMSNPFDLSWGEVKNKFVRGRGGGADPYHQRYNQLEPHVWIEESLGGDPEELPGGLEEGMTKIYERWDNYNFVFLSPKISIRLLKYLKKGYDEASNAPLVLSNEGGIVNYGRAEDLLANVDMLTYSYLAYSPYISQLMKKKGYNLDGGAGASGGSLLHQTSEDLREKLSSYADVGTTNNQNYLNYIKNDYISNTKINSMFSPKGGYSDYAINRINAYQYRNDIPLNASRLMSINWLISHTTYSGVLGAYEKIMTEGAGGIIQGVLVKGLLEKSTIDQVARLVFNVPSAEFLSNSPQQSGGPSINGIDPTLLILAEEERSIITSQKTLQSTDRNIDPGDFGALKIRSNSLCFSLPVAEVKVPISKLNQQWVDCVHLADLKRSFLEKAPELTKALMRENENDNDPAILLKYLFPPKRYQALATVFATTALHGYSTMPSLMEVPKSNIGFLMNITSMTPRERQDLSRTLNQADLYKSMFDNKASDPRAIECFDLPFSGEFLNSFLSLLYEAIKEFPSLLFRGIAGLIDPAYREMKLHWEQCNIKDLNYSALGSQPAFNRVKKQNFIAGAWHTGGDTQKDQKYAALLPAALSDTAYALGNLPWNPAEAGRSFLWVAENLTGYMYKGPISLLDSAFQFNVPCLDLDIEWPKDGSFNFGRYGHPLTPLTLIALATKQLKGDRRIREMAGNCSDGVEIENMVPYSRAHMDELGECPEPEPSPFGPIPTPEDFEPE